MDNTNQDTDKQKDISAEENSIPVNKESKKKKKKEVQKEGTQAEPEIVEKKEPSAEEKLAELQDKYLRLSAEYDNYRKRTLKERIDLLKSGNEDLLSKALPVMDDFERAMQLIDDAKDIKAVKEGLHLIYGKFGSFLSSEGVKEIDALHKTFDTDIHEAITKIPAPSKKLKGKVVDVVQKGYMLNDKIIRFSKVVIGE